MRTVGLEKIRLWSRKNPWIIRCILFVSCSLSTAFSSAFIVQAFKNPFTALIAVLGLTYGTLGLIVYENNGRRQDKRRSQQLEAFANGIDGALRHFMTYMQTKRTASDARAFRSSLVLAASAIMTTGTQTARVCLFQLDRKDDLDSVPNPDGSMPISTNQFFSLIEHAGRSDEPKTREFNSTTEEGRYHIESMLARKQIVIEDVDNPPDGAHISRSDPQQYKSFIATPVLSQSADGNNPPAREVCGSLSIDYPGRREFTTLDETLHWAVSKLFTASFLITENDPISSAQAIHDVKLLLNTVTQTKGETL